MLTHHLTFVGRSKLVSLLKDQELFLAWGTGDPAWDTVHNTTAATLSGTLPLQLPGTNLRGVTVMLGSNHATVYLEGSDYTVDYELGRIMRVLGGNLPSAGTSLYIEYVLNPPIGVDADELIAEVGRQKIINKQFVTRDDAGSLRIVTNGVTAYYSVSDDPTDLLYLDVIFDFGAASDQTIREIGLFTDTEILSGLPGGQLYFTPNEVVDNGKLISRMNILPLVRSVSNQESFSMVIGL